MAFISDWQAPHMVGFRLHSHSFEQRSIMNSVSVFRRLYLVLLFMGIVLMDAGWLSAQPPVAATAVATPTPSASMGRDSSSYPPMPVPFYRGSHPTQPRMVGFYFHNLMLIFLLGMFVIWVWTANWIDTDAHDLKVRPQLWNSIVLLTGVLGFVGSLCAPNWFLSFLSMTAGYGIPMGIYVAERNKRGRLGLRRH